MPVMMVGVDSFPLGIRVSMVVLASSVPGWAVLDIGLLHGGDLVVGQFDVEGGDGLAEVVGCGRADDRGRDQRVAQYPGQGDLGHAHVALLGDLLDGVDDGYVMR